MKIMKFRFIILLFYCSQFIHSQKYIANTDLYKNPFPFAISEFLLYTAKTDLQVKIPQDAKAYLIKRIKFEDGKCCYLLIYKDAQNIKHISVDTNGNLSFLDEETYMADRMHLKSDDYSYNDIQQLPLFNLKNSSNNSRFIRLCSNSTGAVYNSDQENDLYLSAYLSDHLEADIKCLNCEFKVYIFNESLYKDYHKNNTKIYIIPKDSVAMAESINNQFCSIGDSITFSHVVICVDSVSPNGKQFFYSFSSNKSKKLFGVVSDKLLRNKRFIDIDGNINDLYSNEKMYTLIDFWGTWCNPCMALNPLMDSLYNDYSKNIHFVGVANDTNIDLVRKYNKQHHNTWVNFIQNKTDDVIIKTLKISAYPTFFLVDNNGKIVIRDTGRIGLLEIYKYLNLRFRKAISTQNEQVHK